MLKNDKTILFGSDFREYEKTKEQLRFQIDKIKTKTKELNIEIKKLDKLNQMIEDWENDRLEAVNDGDSVIVEPKLTYTEMALK